MIALDPRVWVLEVALEARTLRLDPVAMFRDDGNCYVVSTAGDEWMLGGAAENGVGQVSLSLREAGSA